MKATKKFKDLSREEKENLVIALNETKNTLDFLQLLNIYFDLAENQPGQITKGIISRAMVNTVLPMLNPTVKNGN
jgi:hypothetical protein